MKSNSSKKRSARKAKVRKEIVFDANVLLARLREHREALEGKRKLTMRTTIVRIPRRAPRFRARDITAIREKLHVSQPLFASLLNVPLATARSWEQGTRKPSGAALRLLEIVGARPETVLETVGPQIKERETPA
jgi:putative transcriptional regulator